MFDLPPPPPAIPECRVYKEAVDTPCGAATAIMCTPDAGAFVYYLPPSCTEQRVQTWTGTRGRTGWRGHFRWWKRTVRYWKRKGWA